MSVRFQADEIEGIIYHLHLWCEEAEATQDAKARQTVSARIRDLCDTLIPIASAALKRNRRFRATLRDETARLSTVRNILKQAPFSLGPGLEVSAAKLLLTLLEVRESATEARIERLERDLVYFVRRRNEEAYDSQHKMHLGRVEGGRMVAAVRQKKILQRDAMIRKSALAMKKRGTSNGTIVGCLARRENLSQRHIRRIAGRVLA
jgi:hypothetical protein